MDGGPDAFLRAKPHARALCEELGLASELIPTNPDRRRVYVLHRGRLHALPEGFRLTVPTKLLPFLGTRLFSLGGKLRMLYEPFVPARQEATEESVSSFVLRRFGKEALERVGEPLLAGIHCGDAAKLSMDLLFPNLVALERKHGSLTRGMAAEASRGEESVFLSLAGGMCRLVERLAQEDPGHDPPRPAGGRDSEARAAFRDARSRRARRSLRTLLFLRFPSALRRPFSRPSLLRPRRSSRASPPFRRRSYFTPFAVRASSIRSTATGSSSRNPSRTVFSPRRSSRRSFPRARPTPAC